MRIIHIQPRSRAGALALGAGVVIAGAVLLVVGLSLLLALAAGGVIAGTGYALYRRITGQRRGRMPGSRRGAAALGLDPRLEVHPPDEQKRHLPPRPGSPADS